MQATMSNYHLKPLPTLPSQAVQEKKAARKKLLEEVAKRRKLLYQRFREKMKQMQTGSDVI
jgi:hypothetical protein